jgi:DNA repair exonuclease SbcCD ATPase subunit
MALTRKMLKAMGVEDEKIDQIIEAHSETVDGLKDKLRKAEEDAEDLKDVQKELDDLKKKTDGSKDWEKKFNDERKAFEDFKKEIAGKETAAAKEKAVRAYFEGKGIKGDNLEIAIRGAKDEIAGLELDGEKIKDAKSLDDLVAGTYKGLVVKTQTGGAGTGTPPGNNGGKKTKEEIMAIKDAGERQKQIALNHEMFGF